MILKSILAVFPYIFISLWLDIKGNITVPLGFVYILKLFGVIFGVGIAPKNLGGLLKFLGSNAVFTELCI